MIKCKFLNYREESNFQRDLNAGNIPEGAIAFIHNPREIWARGIYYPCGSLSDTEIANIENRISQSLGDDINTLVENLTRSINEALARKADTSEIPTIPTNVSAFNNDAQYVTISQLNNAAFDGKVQWDDIQGKPDNIGGTEQVQANWAELNPTSKSYIQNKPTLAAVATTGSYNDLSNKPTIPTSTLGLTNDAGFITSEQLKKINNESLIGTGNINISSGVTSYNDLENKPIIDTSLNESSTNAVQNKVITAAINELDGRLDNLKSVARTGDYNDLSNRPAIPEAQVQSDWNQTNLNAKDYIQNKPTKISAFINDVGYIIAGEGGVGDVQADWNQTNETDPSYINNKPTIPSVDNELNAQSPNALANSVITNAINSINTKFDNLHTVATTGKYSDLTGKPEIPSNIAELTNIDVLKTITLESLGGATQLTQLGDTDISSPQAGQALVYITQNGEGKWINGTPTDPFFIKLALVAGGAQPGSWNGIEVNNNFFDLNGDETVNTDDLTVASDLRNYALGFVADYAKNFYGKKFATEGYVDGKIISAPESMEAKLFNLYNLIADNFVLKSDVPYESSSEAPVYNPLEEVEIDPEAFVSYTYIRPIHITDYENLQDKKNNVCYLVYDE